MVNCSQLPINWSQLPINLLAEITEHLTLYEDFVAFGSVCTSWRSVATMEKPRFLSKLTPWLMLAPQKPTDQRSFFSVSEDSTRTLFLPEVNSRKCFSSRGWLLTIAEGDLSMALLHPFSRCEIELPHLKTFRDWEAVSDSFWLRYVLFISKFVLSSNPMCTSDYLVMVLYGHGGRVAYCKPGDKSWTTIETPRIYNYDITCYKGLYYVINDQGQILLCDITTNVAVEVAHRPDRKSLDSTLYMLESAGALLVVERDGVTGREIEEGSEECTYGTFAIRVFQVDLSNNTWTEIKDLGTRTLFVGYNSSFSVEASSYCKSNCIYFTDDCKDAYEEGGKDMGIYNLVDGSIEPHFPGSSYCAVNPPMWVQPSFSSSF